jgi:hypothetical protein
VTFFAAHEQGRETLALLSMAFPYVIALLDDSTEPNGLRGPQRTIANKR